MLQRHLCGVEDTTKSSAAQTDSTNTNRRGQAAVMTRTKAYKVYVSTQLPLPVEWAVWLGKLPLLYAAGAAVAAEVTLLLAY
jgi:hypothetical protein